jgi:hypothetical protein
VERPRFAVEALADQRKRMPTEGNLAAPVVLYISTRNYIDERTLALVRQGKGPKQMTVERDSDVRTVNS